MVSSLITDINNCSSSEQPVVRFASSIQVREYERIIDATSMYLGLALGWEYRDLVEDRYWGDLCSTNLAKQSETAKSTCSLDGTEKTACSLDDVSCDETSLYSVDDSIRTTETLSSSMEDSTRSIESRIGEQELRKIQKKKNHERYSIFFQYGFTRKHIQKAIQKKSVFFLSYRDDDVEGTSPTTISFSCKGVKRRLLSFRKKKDKSLTTSSH